MGKVPVQIRSRKPRLPLKHATREDILNDKFEGIGGPLDTQHLLISALLPSAVKAFMQELEREVDAVCGDRYKHGKSIQRWGTQGGSIILANQHVAVEKPRVRSKDGREVKFRPDRFNSEIFMT
jgi:hypothetical protein